MAVLASPALAQDGLPFPITDEPSYSVPIVDVEDGAVPIVDVDRGRGARPVDWLRQGGSLEGTWIVRGQDALGEYSGEIRITRRGTGYTYERRLDIGNDSGSIDAAFGRVFLRERLGRRRLGLLDVPGAGVFDRPSRPRRMGTYWLSEDGRSMVGRGWLAGEPGQSHETLHLAGGRVANNDVELLIDGPEAFPAIYDAISNARQQICLQTFSWLDGPSGERMARLLGRKVLEGVEVRCLVEAFPQFGGWRWKTGKLLEQLGVEVILHNKFWRGVATSLGRNFRRLVGLSVPAEERGVLTHDHRKVIVVDGRVAFTGGMNIGDKYEEGTTWHDIHCRVEGSAVSEMEALFWDRWRAAGGEGRAMPPVRGDPWPGDLLVDVQENLPGVRLEITNSYLEEIAGARSEILITNPYMLYDPVVAGLKRRASEGLRTVVILPSNDLNDEALARDAFFYIQNDIVRSGIELYKYRDRMTHGKVAVFDRARTTVGTTNLDAMAMERNTELNLFIRDRGFAAETIRRVFDVDLPQSDRIGVERLSWWERVKGFVMHLLRRFL